MKLVCCFLYATVYDINIDINIVVDINIDNLIVILINLNEEIYMYKGEKTILIKLIIKIIMFLLSLNQQ